MTTYAITGHKGLIGTFLKQALDKEGFKCVLQIDQREGFNINDLMFKEFEVNDKIDIFFHFAAQCRINESIAKPILSHKNNVDGILAVLEFCRKHDIKKIVFASSSRVLSDDKNPYVASKIYGEELIKAYQQCYGIEYIIIRPSTVYGPMYDLTSRLINNFISAAWKGEEMRIYGDKGKTLDFTYISDFVAAIILAIKSVWNTDYNISGESEYNIYSLAKMIKKKLNSKSLIKFYPAEIAQPQKVKINTTKIRSLGWKPKISITKGVDNMIKFYKQNPFYIENYKDKGREFYETQN